MIYKRLGISIGVVIAYVIGFLIDLSYYSYLCSSGYCSFPIGFVTAVFGTVVIFIVWAFGEWLYWVRGEV